MSEDFSKGKRGSAVRAGPNEERITIHLDANIIEHRKRLVHEAGGGNYQTLIHDALREHLRIHNSSLEDTLRKVIREELRKAV